MLVTIVSVANADNTGLDLDRLEKVEDLDPEIARKMLDFGSARTPSDDELAAYHKARQPSGGAEPDATQVEGGAVEPARSGLTFTPSFKTTPSRSVKKVDPASDVPPESPAA